MLLCNLEIGTLFMKDFERFWFNKSSKVFSTTKPRKLCKKDDKCFRVVVEYTRVHVKTFTKLINLKF